MNTPAPSATATASPPAGSKALRFTARVVVFLAVAWCVGTLSHKATARADTDPSPAGFGRGVLHGAMMPLALPGLALGKDVSIYAERNTGRTYKLGYTAGVNGCGLIFFGLLFWRVRRWRHHCQ